jgi:glycosyltransferase involved in cell wall biosynthesis
VSFKLGQYFALGKAVVGQKVINNSSSFYAHPDFERQFAFEEPQDIAAKAEELLNQPEELERLSESNRNRYDLQWTPSAIANEILKTVFSEIEPVGKD